jgi:hypothetical protein
MIRSEVNLWYFERLRSIRALPMLCPSLIDL